MGSKNRRSKAQPPEIQLLDFLYGEWGVEFETSLFFYNPCTQLGRHLLRIADIYVQLFVNLRCGKVILASEFG